MEWKYKKKFFIIIKYIIDRNNRSSKFFLAFHFFSYQNILIQISFFIHIIINMIHQISKKLSKKAIKIHSKNLIIKFLFFFLHKEPKLLISISNFKVNRSRFFFQSNRFINDIFNKNLSAYLNVIISNTMFK